jgi:hypothetical protein
MAADFAIYLPILPTVLWDRLEKPGHPKTAGPSIFVTHAKSQAAVL